VKYHGASNHIPFKWVKAQKCTAEHRIRSGAPPLGSLSRACWAKASDQGWNGGPCSGVWFGWLFCLSDLIDHLYGSETHCVGRHLRVTEGMVGRDSSGCLTVFPPCQSNPCEACSMQNHLTAAVWPSGAQSRSRGATQEKGRREPGTEQHLKSIQCGYGMYQTGCPQNWMVII
jgi:hypothetical protein